MYMYIYIYIYICVYILSLRLSLLNMGEGFETSTLKPPVLKNHKALNTQLFAKSGWNISCNHIHTYIEGGPK